MEHPARDVAAELVAAEQEARARRLQGLAGRGADRVARAEPRRPHRHRRERGQDHEADQGAAVPHEAGRRAQPIRIRGSTKA